MISIVGPFSRVVSSGGRVFAISTAVIIPVRIELQPRLFGESRRIFVSGSFVAVLLSIGVGLFSMIIGGQRRRWWMGCTSRSIRAFVR